MIKYFRAFLLLSAFVNVFAIPLNFVFLLYLGPSIPADRWALVIAAYVFALIAIAAILFFVRKTILDGNTKDGRKAYYRTAITLSIIFGIDAFRSPSTYAGASTLHYAKDFCFFVSMPISAAALIWLSPKLRSLAGQKSSTRHTNKDEKEQ